MNQPPKPLLDRLPAIPPRPASKPNVPQQGKEEAARKRLTAKLDAMSADELAPPAVDPRTAAVAALMVANFVGEDEIHLTPNEYKLLVVLARNAGKVLTHQQLLREVWGPNHANDTQYLRVYMGQLRHKLEKIPAQPRYLVTEPGVGYRLREE